MKFISTVLTVLLVFAGVAMAGSRVVTVQSTRIPPYEEAIKGFSEVCKAPIDNFVISEMVRTAVPDIVAGTQPALILAVGLDALEQAGSVDKVPIVYVMVLDPDSVISGNRRVTGVRMEVPPQLQFENIRAALPHTAAIGTLYDPSQTGSVVQTAHTEARKLNLRFLAEPVAAPQQVPSALANLEGKIDALWMLPDITVLTAQTVEFIMLFSLQHQVPVVTFSEKYLDTGAFMAISWDAVDMGRQAGELANDILFKGRKPKSFSIEARSAVVRVNQTVAGKLKIPVADGSAHNKNGKN